MLYTAAIVHRFGFLLIAVVAAAFGQHGSTFQLKNPFQSARDREEGGAIFRYQCASCHRADGRGGSGGSNLAGGAFKYAVSEEAMYRVITQGIPGTAMPPFPSGGVRVWQVITFIASLREGPRGENGNAQRGSHLVDLHGCLKCHASGAPELPDAARRLSHSELRQALLEPDATVAPEYWGWKGTLRGQQVVEGRRLNEDTFSVQVMDRSGRLRTIPKTALLKVVHEPRSPMPSYQGKLKESEIDDVLTYLESLR